MSRAPHLAEIKHETGENGRARNRLGVLHDLDVLVRAVHVHTPECLDRSEAPRNGERRAGVARSLDQRRPRVKCPSNQEVELQSNRRRLPVHVQPPVFHVEDAIGDAQDAVVVSDDHCRTAFLLGQLADAGGHLAAAHAVE